jgi:hypothetical protein
MVTGGQKPPPELGADTRGGASAGKNDSLACKTYPEFSFYRQIHRSSASGRC